MLHSKENKSNFFSWGRTESQWQELEEHSLKRKRKMEEEVGKGKWACDWLPAGPAASAEAAF